MNGNVGDEQCSKILENLTRIQERIDAAARRSKRNSRDVRLVVVSKGQPVEVIEAAIHAGVQIFGENYAEQAVPKIEALRGSVEVEWHMIGHVQSRKANLVSKYFDCIHSLDSIKLAEKLNSLASESGKVIPVLLEINLGGEETKSGWRISTEDDLEGIVREFNQIKSLQNLCIRGLMTMPPMFDDPEHTRPYFRRLHNLSSILKRRLPDVDWIDLSMGTSADFEIAVEEGATLVRIGQAILGPRLYRY